MKKVEVCPVGQSLAALLMEKDLDVVRKILAVAVRLATEAQGATVVEAGVEREVKAATKNLEAVVDALRKITAGKEKP